MPLLDPIIEFILSLVDTQLIGIPLENPLSILYVVLNLVMLLLAAFGGGAAL